MQYVTDKLQKRHLSESQAKQVDGWRDNGGGVLRFCGMMMKREEGKGDGKQKMPYNKCEGFSSDSERDNTRELIMQFLIQCTALHAAAAVTNRRCVVSCVYSLTRHMGISHNLEPPPPLPTPLFPFFLQLSSYYPDDADSPSDVRRAVWGVDARNENAKTRRNYLSS